MAQLNKVHLIMQVAISFSYIVGSALAAYNVTAFKTDKYGLYFHDDNQLWVAIGVGMVVIGWVLRNWKKF